jgi:hypothetical protein
MKSENTSPFAQLAPDSRLWIYQSNRELTPTDEVQVANTLRQFVSEWFSHGMAMKADFAIWHHRVIVIALDETTAAASGCGIDKCVRCMDQLGQQMGINFLQRNLVVFQQDGDIQQTELNQFWALRKAQRIDDETLLIDTTMQKLVDWPSDGWTMFKNSWHHEMWSR